MVLVVSFIFIMAIENEINSPDQILRKGEFSFFNDGYYMVMEVYLRGVWFLKPVWVLANIIILMISLSLYPVVIQARESVLEPAYDIVIDVGHGGIDGGTSVNGVLEKDINLAIGLKLFQALKGEGFKVGITRVGDYALSDDSSFKHIRSRHKRDLKQRALIAESLRPKLFISLHVNWSKSKRTRGPLVIYQPNDASYHLAQLVQDHLNTYYALQRQPKKGRSYFLMKELAMPAIIVELGFLSNEEDFYILTNVHTQDQLVNRMVQAVNEYFLLFPDEMVP